MSLKNFNETCSLTWLNGEKRAKQSISQTLLLSFLGGSYIAIGGFLALLATSTMPPEVWGSLSKLTFGMLFPLGLMIILLTGAELFTGNCLTVSGAFYEKQVSAFRLGQNWLFSWVGNFAGALIFAYFFAYLSGLVFTTELAGSKIVALANAKVGLSFSEAFLRGIVANWLVCLAVFIAATSSDLVSKVVGLWLPVMAFVTIGGEHSIANMFFVPLGIFVGSDAGYIAAGYNPALAAGWSDFLLANLLPVTLGNIVGGALFVAGFYYWAFKKY